MTRRSASRPHVTPKRPPRIWKFWGTSLWGLFVFAAMFAGQIAVVAWFVLRREGPIDLAAAIHVVGGGLTISLSVIMGLPAVLAALWIAIRVSRTPFADYLALRWTSWSNLAIGIGCAGRAGRGLGPAVARDRARGRARLHGRRAEIGAGRRRAVAAGDRVLRRSARHGGVFRARLSLSRLVGIVPAVPGAILLSSLVWTALHLQYDWFFFGEVFSIGLLLGYLRYRSNSTWLTVVVHGLNNLAATLQTSGWRGRADPRRRERTSIHLAKLDCFAALAMTIRPPARSRSAS